MDFPLSFFPWLQPIAAISDEEEVVLDVLLVAAHEPNGVTGHFQFKNRFLETFAVGFQKAHLTNELFRQIGLLHTTNA